MPTNTQNIGSNIAKVGVSVAVLGCGTVVAGFALLLLMGFFALILLAA